MSEIEAERIGGGGASYGRIVKALHRGLPSAKRVEDAGTGFGIKTALAADLLKIAGGGVLESESLPKQDALNPGQNTKKSTIAPFKDSHHNTSICHFGLSREMEQVLNGFFRQLERMPW